MGRGGRGAANGAIGTSARAEKAPGQIYRELTLDMQNNLISVLAENVERGELDLNPPYQRESVWGEERQRNLIRSLSMGLPVGAVFINQRSWEDPEVVIDGKQRITAVANFLSDGFAVPREWFPDRLLKPEAHEKEEIRFSDFSSGGQMGWKNTSLISVYRTGFTGSDAVSEEEKLFELINYGGVPQGERDSDSEAALGDSTL